MHATRPLLPLLALAAPAVPQQETAPALAVAAASSGFALDLYGQLAQRDGNLFLSPFSVFVALAMTSEGAAGETLAQLDRALHLGGTSPAERVRALTAALRPPEVPDGSREGTVPAYELHVANRLFGDDDARFLESFTRLLAGAYGAPLERVDFDDPPAARRRINEWVEERTEGRIQDVVPEGLPARDTLLALANAVYFKAAWAEPFQESATAGREFTTGAGEEVQVPMMRRTGQLGYFEDERLQVLEIPYRGAETAMVLLLPRRRDGLAELERAWTAADLDRWLAALRSTRVDAQVPRFEITRALELDAPLRALGVTDAFSPERADLSRMSADDRLCVGPVLHKAFIAVDEAGTEAAAATVVMVQVTSVPSGEPVAFVADHPFLFLIRHRASGCILFLGRVDDPRAAG